MHECMARGLTPESPAAPKNIREAIARFFEEGQSAGSVFSGQVQAWPNEKRREVSEGVVLDYDDQGNLAGIDIDHASRKLDLREVVTSHMPVAAKATS